MAHLEGVLNGLILFAVAGVWRRLSLDDTKKKVAAWALIITGYGNVVAAVIGASTGNRGLALEGPLANVVVFVLFLVAVIAVFVGLGLIAYGARPAAGAVTARVHVEVTTNEISDPSGREPSSEGSASRASRRRSRNRR